MLVMTVKYRLVVLVGVFTVLSLLFYTVQKHRKPRHCKVNTPTLRTIADIENILKLERCGVIENVLSMYSIQVEGAQIKIPKTFEEKVSGWLGGDKHLLEQARHQKVIQITNR